MSRLFKDKKGVTLTEVIMAGLLLSLIFLVVSNLYVAAQKFFIKSTQNVIESYETQYAIQHIYKYAMRGIGDKTTPAFQVSGGNTQLDISIHNNDLASPPTLTPLTEATYGNVTNCRYRYDAVNKALMFSVGAGSEESLIPKVTVTDVNFTESGNSLTGYIEAYYNDINQKLRFYFSCYPRLASFN